MGLIATRHLLLFDFILFLSRENSAEAFPISSGVSAIYCGGVIQKNQVCCRDEDAKREVSEED